MTKIGGKIGRKFGSKRPKRLENGPKWSQNGAKIDFDHQKKMEEVEKKDEEQESERIKRRKRSKDQK